MTRLARRLPVSLLASAALLAGCGGDATDAPGDAAGTFAGRVAGTAALVVIVTDGTDLRAYLCDGTPDGRLTVSEWFRAKQRGGAIDTTSLGGNARLAADVRAGAAGFYLYKAEHGGRMHWAGWIVLPDGEQRGSMAEPTRTSAGVVLNIASGTAQLPGIGTVSPGRLTPRNVIAGFGGGCSGFGCP